MIDVEKLTEEYFKSITIRHRDGCILATPMFFHIGNDESIALKFSETEDGRPIVTDCGTTRDYLEIMEINLKIYQDKLNAIKERFFIEEDENGAFVMVIPTDTLNRVQVFLGYFIQAISIIANIDL